MNLEKLQNTARIVQNVRVLLANGLFRGDGAGAIAEAKLWAEEFQSEIEKVIEDVKKERAKTPDSPVPAEGSTGLDSKRNLDRERGDSKDNSVGARHAGRRVRKTKT